MDFKFILHFKLAVDNLNWDDIAINGLTITNLGFETTDSGWTYSENKASFTGSYSTSAYNGGTKSYLMQYPASTASSANDYCKISQTVTNDAPTPTPVPYWNSKASWTAGVHDLGSGNSGNINTEFDLTPQVTNVNTTVGYTATGVTVDDWSKTAMIIAMDSSQGYFTVTGVHMPKIIL